MDRLPSVIASWCLFAVLFFTAQTAFSEAEPSVGLLDFASQPRLSAPTLSPTGRYLAARVNVRERQLLMIREVDDLKKQPFLISGSNWTLGRYRWVSPTDLLLSISIPDVYMGVPQVVTRLVHVDVEKQKQRLLFRKEKSPGFFQVQDSVLAVLRKRDGHFLIQAGKESLAKPHVFVADIKDRRLGTEIAQRSMPNIYDWVADAAGNVRVGLGFTSDQEQAILQLKDGSGEWHDYSHLFDRGAEILALPTNKPNLYYISMQPAGAAADAEPGSAEEGTNGMRQVYILNVITGEEQWRYGRNDSEIAGIRLDSRGETIVSVSYTNEELASELFDVEWRAVQSVLAELTPGSFNYLASVAEDRSRAIFGVEGPTLPLEYYIYHVAEKRLSRLGTSYPNLQSERLAEMHSVSYEARDGLIIPAYLTLPVGLSRESAKGLPFVILPHGGPHARNYKGFDWLVQMLANEGYGVLQMNFRGSTGYGMAFEEAGRKQWGQSMQDDITDGTHWAVAQGLADPKRICIMGGSYGGYAALMGAAKEPSLYKCALSFNGVTDLPALLRSKRRYIGGEFTTRFIGDLWKDRDMLAENSPVNLAAQISVPVLLVHGEDDRIVSVKQSRAMHKAMQKRGGSKVTYVELPGGDHSLTNYANRITFAEESTRFLANHLR